MKRFIPGLAKRKEQYDLLLKDLEKRPVFRIDYPVYFKTTKDTNIDNMSEEDKAAYNSGAGGELKEHKNRYGKIVPPSMLSVASSSRFCYLSLRDSDLSVFGINQSGFRRRFEEKLPILDKGIPPHMDAYYEAKEEICFFECKCHEQFDSHEIKLAESYFGKGLIVDQIFAGKDFIGLKEKSDDGKETLYRKYSPSIFGVSENPRFDIKQLLTHIMGIRERMKKEPSKKARLIYFYFIPKAVEANKDLQQIIDLLEEETKTIFKFVKRYVNDISFNLYFQRSNTVTTAQNNNVEEIIK